MLVNKKNISFFHSFSSSLGVSENVQSGSSRECTKCEMFPSKTKSRFISKKCCPPFFSPSSCVVGNAHVMKEGNFCVNTSV